MLRHVADQHGLWLEDLYKQVGWPLYRKYGHAFDAFSKHLLCVYLSCLGVGWLW